MKAMFLFEMKKNMQNRGMLFWMIILPIAFTVLFISVFTADADGAMKQQVTLSIVPGYAVMFVFFIMISMVSGFLKDRDLGLTARIASTPLPPYVYLLGKWIPFMFIVWVQILILLLFGKFVYDIPIAQPIFVVFLSIALSFTTTGIGLALAMIVKTENMGIAITQVIALGGAVLGGLWMPIDLLPKLIQTIAHGLPQYWAHQALQDALSGTLIYKFFFQSLFMILAIGCVSFVIAILRYQYFLKQARG